jgi:hypothetical protein
MAQRTNAIGKNDSGCDQQRSIASKTKPIDKRKSGKFMALFIGSMARHCLNTFDTFAIPLNASAQQVFHGRDSPKGRR